MEAIMHVEESTSFENLLSKLADRLGQPAERHKAFVGLDGFIDEIIHIVDVRYSTDSFRRIPTIQAYADRIAGGSHMSTNIELVSQQIKMGGNGPILANGLLNYEVEVVYMGVVGSPELDPIFSSLRRCSKIISLGPPANTDALEFSDGKIIASKLTPLNAVTWENMLEKCSIRLLTDLFRECDYMAFCNWSMIIDMNQIWEGFLSTIIPGIDPSGKHLFFDLADPEKRTESDLRTALSLISRFSEAGFRVTLSMNLKEACQISEALGKTIPDYHTANTQEILSFLTDRMGLHCIVIHLVDGACCRSGNNSQEAIGPFCKEPKLTTGAGDNFNAGFLYGMMRGLSLKNCLILGNAASGYYVRHAKSPTVQELIDFLTLWKNNPELS